MSEAVAAGVLHPVPPFDFEKSLAFLAGFPPARGEQTTAGAALTKATSVNGLPVAFEVASTGSMENPRLRYTLHASRALTDAEHAAVRDRISFFLSVDDDLRPFYTIGEADAAFAPVLRRLHGYHQVKFLTPFENACWAVLTQRNRTAAARSAKAALSRRSGGAVAVNGMEYRVFPEPAQLLELPVREITELVGQERRALYLAAVADAFLNADEAWLRTAPSEEVREWLRAIPGIGPWSAGFILLRGLGRMDEVPEEGKLLEAVREVYRPGEALTPAAVREIAEPYGPWKGYWAHYLRAGS